MHSFSDKFLDETTEFWQGRSGCGLSREDSRQIIENLVGFFQLLDDWDTQDRHAGGSVEPVRDTGRTESNLVVIDENGLSQPAESRKLVEIRSGERGGIR